eukprot:GDKJ01011609.1.p1 GENE.GDKJ01011609.1~~GDKJ01011609.1.p1  ORF type:complete len:341 (+),score=68.27 GDKJ01011609.1:33-1055(+)
MSVIKNCFLAGGIYFFYLLSSIAQEGIYTTGNKDISDTFKYPIFLVFAMCFGSALSAWLIVLLMGDGVSRPLHVLKLRAKDSDKSVKSAFNPDIARSFFLISLTYIGAMLCSNYALTQVNYPTQVLVKSAKMVPIVIGGLLIYRHRYPWYDYLSVIIVTVALIVFNLASSKSSGTSNTLLGIGLCFLSLMCDGLTGPRQDFLNKKYVIKPMDHMLMTNLFACIPSFLAMLVFESTAPIEFMTRYPDVMSKIATFCLCNTLGQVFIYNALTSLGSLYVALITTTRKFFSVLLSIFFYAHTLLPLQWASVVAVFGALLIQTIFSQKAKDKAKAALKKGEKKE